MRIVLGRVSGRRSPLTHCGRNGEIGRLAFENLREYVSGVAMRFSEQAFLTLEEAHAKRRGLPSRPSDNHE